MQQRVKLMYARDLIFMPNKFGVSNQKSHDTASWPFGDLALEFVDAV